MDDPRSQREYRPVRSPLMSMGPSLDEERRRHRVARIVAVASLALVVVVVLVVWGVSLLGREVVDAARTPDATQQRATTTGAPVQQAGAPAPQTLAEAVVEEGSTPLRLQVPIRREAITGVGFGPRHEPGVMQLEPSGTRANTSWLRRATQRFLSTTPPGDFTWYQLGDGTLAMVVVGASPGTEVYAPIDGTVAAISDYEIDGAARGKLIQLQPVGDGQTLIVLRNIDADADLKVGTTVDESVTRLGTVRDMEGVIEAPLARYTHDSGSGVDMYVLRLAHAASTGF